MPPSCAVILYTPPHLWCPLPFSNWFCLLPIYPTPSRKGGIHFFLDFVNIPHPAPRVLYDHSLIEIYLLFSHSSDNKFSAKTRCGLDVTTTNHSINLILGFNTLWLGVNVELLISTWTPGFDNLFGFITVIEPRYAQKDLSISNFMKILYFIYVYIYLTFCEVHFFIDIWLFYGKPSF